jgi:hypothetical protein
MINEKELKETIRMICGGIRCDGIAYRVSSDRLHSQTEQMIKGNYRDIQSLVHNASALRVAYEKYWYRKRDLLRICETLGDDYLNIYKDILGDD